MNINLSLRFDHPDAVSHYVRYRRIDNNPNSPFVSVSPNPVASPARIAENIPNGQYEISSRPVYADGRICSDTLEYTDGCPGLTAINAYIAGANLVVTYTAPLGAPKVRIVVSWPNGGTFSQLYPNNGTPIVVPIPNNAVGNIAVNGQTVCDEDSGFYSSLSGTINVPTASGPGANNFSIQNDASVITIVGLTGVTGFTLENNIPTGDDVAGQHSAFFGGITLYFTGTPGSQSKAELLLNGVIVQCQNVPNSDSGSVTFSPISVSGTDQLDINFSIGSCPGFTPSILGNYGYTTNEGDLCGALLIPLYTISAFGPGVIVYVDEARTTPLVGYAFIRESSGGNRFLNPATGEVGNVTGNTC